MLYIAENLRKLRRKTELTQEDVAEMLHVSPQSVSKWERGDTYPDITLLPSLANLFNTSIDALIGMDKINDEKARTTIFNTAHAYLRSGNFIEASAVLEAALKTYPNDESIMSELAIALALSKDFETLNRSASLCEKVLAGNPHEKVRHTTRAALCFIYYKLGDKNKAINTARNLPHIRESREEILAQIEKEMSQPEIDNAYLKFLALGEEDEQDIICIDFGIDMISMANETNLIENINALRTKYGQKTIPRVRIRDNTSLLPKQVRLRYYAEYLIDKEFSDIKVPAEDILIALSNIADTLYS